MLIVFECVWFSCVFKLSTMMLMIMMVVTFGLTKQMRGATIERWKMQRSNDVENSSSFAVNGVAFVVLARLLRAIGN